MRTLNGYILFLKEQNQNLDSQCDNSTDEQHDELEKSRIGQFLVLFKIGHPFLKNGILLQFLECLFHQANVFLENDDTVPQIGDATRYDFFFELLNIFAEKFQLFCGLSGERGRRLFLSGHFALPPLPCAE